MKIKVDKKNEKKINEILKTKLQRSFADFQHLKGRAQDLYDNIPLSKKEKNGIILRIVPFLEGSVSGRYRYARIVQVAHVQVCSSGLFLTEIKRVEYPPYKDIENALRMSKLQEKKIKEKLYAEFQKKNSISRKK